MESGPGVIGSIRSMTVSRTGEMYVLDSQFGNVKVFDSTGAFVRMFGRPGQGPGELDHARSISVGNDTVFVLGERITMFSTAGAFLGLSPSSVGRLMYASRIIHTSHGLLAEFGSRGAERGDVREDVIELLPVDIRNAAFAPPVARVPRSVHQYGMGMEGTQHLANFAEVWVEPNGVVSVSAADGSFTVSRTTFDGDSLPRIHSETERVRTTDQDYEDRIGFWTQAIAIMSPRDTALIPEMERLLRKGKPVDFRPAIGLIAAGENGTLIQRYDVSDRPYAAYATEMRSAWVWILPDGQPALRIMLPNGFTPVAFAGCRVTGTIPDDAGRDLIVAYRLSVPGYVPCDGAIGAA